MSRAENENRYDLEALRELSIRASQRSEQIHETDASLVQLETFMSREIQDALTDLRLMITRQRVLDTIDQIRLRLRIAALQGRSSAVIMDIQSTESRGRVEDSGYDPSDPGRLQGAARSVYEHLAQYGLNPTISGPREDYFVGTSPRDTGYFIVANFGEPQE